jgi:zinc protease
VGITAEFVRGRETMAGQARLFGYFELLRGGMEKAGEYLERYRGVDAGQVATAARRHLRPESMSMLLQLPEGAEAPDQAAVAAAVKRIYAELVPAAGANGEGGGQTLANAARKVELSNGLTLIVKPQRAVPLVSLVLAVPGGQAAEEAAQAGLYQLWSRAVTRGTEQHSFEQINQELESMAGGIGAFAARSTAGLTGSFLSQDWRRGLEMMAETWREPAFPPEQVARAKTEQQAALRAQEDSPTARAFKAFRALIYGDHPYGRDPLGTPESLAGLNREALLKAHAALRGPRGVVLSVVGEVEPEAVRAEAERLFSGLNGQAAKLELPVPRTPAQAQEKKISDPKAKQTQIVLGYPAPSANDPRRFALQVLDSLLGGQGGRLFHDLRDQRSLAYAVQPFYSASWHAGVFGMYMAVGPGKQDEALKGLAEQIALLHDGEPSLQEMERAKSYLLGKEAVGLQSYATQAMTMAVDELLGLGFDNYLGNPAKVQALTAADLREAARQVLNPGAQTLLTLGP